jgi:hypothetical protein
MITHAEPVADRRSRGRPRWLVPALAVATGAAVLLYLGVVTPSSLLSIGLFGGMIGMHLFGHGAHGGHGDHGTHDQEHALTATPADAEQDGQAAHRGCH